MIKKRSILVQDIQISISSVGDEDFISLTDMVKGFEGGEELIKRWLQNRGTIDFLGTWEKINNPNFNLVEFHQISSNIGLNRFIMSAKKWLETGAIGLQAKAGRYGGTFAHRDIAFEFGSWLSPEFKLYLIKEFQRLKELEAKQQSVEWQVKRELAKINYRVHTDAIQQNLLDDVPASKQGFVYANEADMLNAIVFGQTAKQWKLANPSHPKENQRDHCSAFELALIANLESYNAILIDQALSVETRFTALSEAAQKFRASMQQSSAMKKLNDQAKPLLGNDADNK